MTEPINTSAIIRIVGIGRVGIGAVNAMAEQIQEIECMGIELMHSESGTNEVFFRVVLPNNDSCYHSDITSITEWIGDADFVFLVASLDDGLEHGIEVICEALKNRLIKTILLAPEPIAATERRKNVILKRGDSEKSFTAAFPEVAMKMVNNLYSMVLVNHEILSPLCPNTVIQNDAAIVTNYLIQQIIENLIYFITNKPFVRARFTDLRPIWLKAVRYGVGIGIGQWKGAVAVERAISSLKLQAVHSCNIKGVLCQITQSRTTHPDDIKDIKLSLSSWLELDTPVIYGISVDECMDDDIVVVSIMAAEELWHDIYGDSEHWAMLCNVDQVRRIPAFVRKKWYNR